MGLVPQGPDLRSVGLLPPLWGLAVLSAAGIFVALHWAQIPAGLLLLPVVAVIPWLGANLPATFIWTGPSLLVVWTLVVLGCARALTSSPVRSLSGLPVFEWRDGAAAAAVLAAVVMLVFASAIRPVGPSGDEPHYLLIATSMLRDGDIDLANDYTEERHLPFYPGPLTPRHVVLSASGHEYSFHGHGVAVLTVPGLALGGVGAVRLTFLVISALGVAALWTAARLASPSWPSPAVAVGAVLCAMPFMAQSSAIYPDGPGAAIVSLALLTSIRLERGVHPSALWLAATGAALALLPWLHLRFAPLAAAFGIAVLWLIRKTPDRGSNALVFLAAPVISATMLFASTWVMFDTFDPTAPFRQKASGSLAAAPTGILGLLADQEYGLLPYAPAFVFAAGGVLTLTRRLPVTAWAAMLSFMGTLLTGASFVWWGGTSSPARFLVPVLPVLALCISTWWSHAASWSKAVVAALMAVGAAITGAAAFAERGRYVINAPDGRYSIFEWANGLVDLPAAMPSLFRPDTGSAQEAAIALLWAAAAGVLVICVRAARPTRGYDSTLAAWGVVAWITTSTTATWLVRGVDPRQPDRAQLELLQSAPNAWLQTGFASDEGVIAPEDVFSRLMFATPTDDRVVLHAPRVPAGDYRVMVEDAGRIGGTTFALELGRDAWPIQTWTTGEAAPAFSLVLPLHSVRVVANTASPDPAVRLQVHRVNRRSTHPVALRVTRYGSLDVYALDSAPTMETGGFWLPGNRRTAVVVSDQGGNAPSMVLTFESAESATVRVSRGAWHEDHHLDASSRTQVVVPAGEPLRPLQFEISGTNLRRAVWTAVALE
ncbi:MAG TPA: hypothetical protein VMO26_05850 [Vicinamibacterales bacterium]|nr:hypothetical protein [Vicinamibacterales bacterium]